MAKFILPLLIGATAIAGCGRLGDSRANPFGWLPKHSRPAPSIDPEGGYVSASDARPGVPQILSAAWEPLNEGRLLVVQGAAPVKGYRDAALIPVRPQARGKLEPDADGILRLRFVALPPEEGNPAAGLPANPVTDPINVALPLTHRQLARLTGVEISGATNVVTLRR
ncbi:hypothetical protein Q4511_12020 [Paracoccus sp. 1_MG-2023]|uniref:hypothetical protein n=1 Tax=unclassified Paracoccus (in: a-proteobacteria) TaxID=2688777 RepID=UPI001C08AB60|nr:MULTISPECIES: hypothetical protein [unclassified Paracoccus (in: a-proteobacteria)]MBU2957450.1 hypothetical protein [Paracoccus sp. C2R09]MDO6669648.1 hypothetical protein [Paracoccus sp. 1_MG-2023]